MALDLSAVFDGDGLRGGLPDKYIADVLLVGIQMRGGPLPLTFDRQRETLFTA